MLALALEVTRCESMASAMPLSKWQRQPAVRARPRRVGAARFPREPTLPGLLSRADLLRTQCDRARDKLSGIQHSIAAAQDDVACLKTCANEVQCQVTMADATILRHTVVLDGLVRLLARPSDAGLPPTHATEQECQDFLACMGDYERALDSALDEMLAHDGVYSSIDDRP